VLEAICALDVSISVLRYVSLISRGCQPAPTDLRHPGAVDGSKQDQPSITVLKTVAEMAKWGEKRGWRI
jgi:hypothetical protein